MGVHRVVHDFSRTPIFDNAIVSSDTSLRTPMRLLMRVGVSGAGSVRFERGSRK